jgi:hypothetical protein
MHRRSSHRWNRSFTQSFRAPMPKVRAISFLTGLASIRAVSEGGVELCGVLVAQPPCVDCLLDTAALAKFYRLRDERALTAVFHPLFTRCHELDRAATANPSDRRRLLSPCARCCTRRLHPCCRLQRESNTSRPAPRRRWYVHCEQITVRRSSLSCRRRRILQPACQRVAGCVEAWHNSRPPGRQKQ